MTELEKYLLDPQNKLGEEVKFTFSRLGENIPLTLKPVSYADYQNALMSSIKIQKDGTEKQDYKGFMSKICLAGLIDPNPKIEAYINTANENISRRNAQYTKEAEDEYKAKLKEWEKNGEDPKNKPKEIKPDLEKQISTPQELLEYWFFAGEIKEIAENILKISGFGSTLEKVVEEEKK